MEIVPAFVFIFWSTSDYVASNAPQMFLKETILDINRYRHYRKMFLKSLYSI